MRTPGSFVCLMLVALVAFTGCSSPSENERLDDEAMKRARRENKAAEDAAREWFYPRQIHDYFPGMDQVVVVPGGDGPVNTLNTPVYQLLDMRQPTAVKVDAIKQPSNNLYAGQSCYDIGIDACEVLGRNTWMLWAGGNEGFWDWLSRQYGFIDLLRLVDAQQRSTRFQTGGLINEPGMQEPSGPDEFGLWLDEPRDARVRDLRRQYIRRAFGLDSSAGPSQGGGGVYGIQPTGRSMTNYPEGTAYDPQFPPPEIYGLSSGVVGLRLFPNPNFDTKAQKRWKEACGEDAARAGCQAYYGNPDGDPNLIRPYRVGMSCAFCHASYHPLNPPRDLVNPEWVNISGNIGAQYLRPRVAFGNLLRPENFVYHILDSQPPGTIDTSLIASDNINNPNTMNSVFNLPQRALVSFRNPKEQQSAASASLPSIWVNPRNAPGTPDPVPDFWRQIFAKAPAGARLGTKEPLDTIDLTAELEDSNSAQRRVPRILVDGADSIGAYGALARVYLNIGTNYEQWITLHETVLGFLPQKPFTLDGARRHSVYWHATQLRVAPLRDYFLKVTPPMPVLQAGSEEERPAIDTALLDRGRRVFARNCIVCHSSIQPRERHEEMEQFARTHGGQFWEHNPGRWLSDPAYITWADEAVKREDFWRFNYLSTDYRVPINLVNTNACRAVATNAVTGNMWEDYASQSFRSMPSQGPIPFFNPYLGANGGNTTFTPRHATPPRAPASGGGPGFYRVPTLVSIWATAPYLHNNSLGLFNNDPSVKGRLAAFEDGMRKLLWPERRLASSSYNDATPSRLKSDRGLIWRTTQDSYITISGAYVPQILGPRLPSLREVVRRYPQLTRLPWWQKPLPSAVLLLLAFVVLTLFAGRLLTRILGYGLLIAGLFVGAFIYFIGGDIGGLRIGPIPKGTPVSLLANANPAADRAAMKHAVSTTVSALVELRATHATPKQVEETMRTKVAPALMDISRCPDFVMDHGHYYKWFDSMTDADKEALIELLKTF
jgi:hypothetical protein